MANVNFTPARDGTSSASTSQGNTNSYVYQVFLNHRGPDVKKGLATHIYHRLKDLGLSVFLDQKELEGGEELDPQIEGAIRTASVHVAIFSPTYAESRWCLHELVLMREQMLKSGSTIIPVFYKVEPADLRWTRGGDRVYAQHLGVLEGKRTFDGQPRYDPKTIEEWRNALSAVADIVGFELKDKEESQLVQEVVQQVLKKVRKPPLDVAKYPTGLNQKIEDVDRTLSLQRQSEKATILGIIGFGGVGKTTLAKKFFNRERSNYDRSCFLFDVRSTSLPSLQSSLLKDLIQWNAQINSVAEGIGRLKTVSQRSLIILDDIDHIDQLDALCEPVIDTINVGSLILITSRKKDVLRNFGIDESSIYTLKGLNVEHSQELFCCHAFGRPSPVVGFEEVVEKFLYVCDGLPLSLRVLGALLRGEDDLKNWNAQLRKTSKVLPEEIGSTLRISYDALDKEEKQIFLDIACFFIGKDRDAAIRVWDGSNWEGLLGLRKLENRCLVEVDGENCLRMHDHLRDLGRDIAEGLEHPRRLWHFTERARPSFVRGIRRFNRSMLQLHGTESGSVERIFSSQQLPPLVYLHWERCPKSSLAPSIPLNNLSVLHIEGDQLKTLWQHEFQAPLQLRELHIDAPLSKVPKSIGKLKHLEKVFLKTRYLKTISNEFCNLSGLQSLQLVCEQLQTLPKWIGKLSGLQSLHLEGCCRLQTLPDSVGNLSGLQSLHLKGCWGLQTLPDSVGNLSGLQSLHLDGCWVLQTLPDSVGNLWGLQSLHLGCWGLQTLPDSVGNLSGLQSLHLDGCSSVQTLPDSVGNLSGLQSLHLTNCHSLQTLPDSVGNLSGLQSLDLFDCDSLQTLPDSVGNLFGLQSLHLDRCDSLQTLPDSVGNLSSLQSLDLRNCHSLQTLPDSVGNLSGLQSLGLFDCYSLQTLPDSVGNLSGLQSIHLERCSSLQTLPDSVGNLSGLQSLHLDGCSSVQTLPDSVGNLSGLQSLHLSSCSSLQTLPDSVGNLSGLQSLDLCWCYSLQTLPDSVGNLSGLQSLDLSFCSSLQTLPDSVGNLSGLQSLDLNSCSSLQALPDSVGNLSGLQSLDLTDCCSLQTRLRKSLLQRVFNTD